MKNNFSSWKIVIFAKSALKSFLDNHCSMHAAGLTYFSMLALVPILCILLLAAKTFGADDLVRRHINERIDAMIVQIEESQSETDFLGQLLTTIVTTDEETAEARKTVATSLGGKAREVTNAIFERIDNFDVGTLGWIGFILLLWTVISSIGMVEVSFNEIWDVAKPRPIWKRALSYLSVVIILPVIGALAMSMPILNIVKNIIIATLGATWLTEWVSTGLIWFLDSLIFRMAIAMTFATLDFAFLFLALPNCKVDFHDAVKGGAITAVMFGLWMKICTIAQVGVAKSSALYGSFAFLPIILAWLYMSWQIILAGAVFTRAFRDLRVNGGGVE
ncbi:MAG: YihY/virulence factor BrkB family protein [Kiritimatiellae bacterium]|nr:YihY/virulence factor BrkB family protein [Kiritimatiellia bacterium]